MDDFERRLELARAGDREAMEWLVERYQASLAAMVRRRLGPGLRRQLEEEDVQQSVFGELVRDLPHLRAEDERALLAWLAGLVENKLRNKARDAGRQKRQSGPLERLEPGDSWDARCDPPDPGPSPSQNFRHREEVERLQAALNGLPEEQRRVFVLRAFQQQDWPTIARGLYVTVKAAQGRYDRARLALAQRLVE